MSPIACLTIMVDETKLRTDHAYDQFWGSIDIKLDNVDVNDTTLPRRRKLPKRYEMASPTTSIRIHQITYIASSTLRRWTWRLTATSEERCRGPYRS